MTPEDMQMRCAAALRNAIELTEEGSKLRGYIAEALAYADGDASAFTDATGTLLRLDIEDIEDSLYNALLDAFARTADKKGMKPEDRIYFDAWSIWCVANGEGSTT